MKQINVLLLLAFLALGCSKSDDSPTVAPGYSFSVGHDHDTVTELDEVEFNVQSVATPALINQVKWHINDVEQETTGSHMTKVFNTHGTYTVEAEITFTPLGMSNQSTQTVEMTVEVNQRPSRWVVIEKVEIISNAFQSDFYVSGDGYYLRTKFDIMATDSSGSFIGYQSSVDDSNDHGSTVMDYPISWNIASASYGIKVYNTGNYYPYNQGYNARIMFYGASRLFNGDPLPFHIFNELDVDLNPYRALEPETVEINNMGLGVRLTLGWY